MDRNKSHFEVVVIGAGVAGIYQIKLLSDLGIDATVLEAAGGLGVAGLCCGPSATQLALSGT
jgi:cation diffusion facilitator CzcD-associated flavoprotein CzcO